MAISPAGTFSSAIVVSRSRSGAWTGRAAPAEDSTRHPGLAGNRPELELAAGVITLRCTESFLKIVRPHYRMWGRPASLVSFPVGEALEAVVEDGDRLHLTRGATTDLAVTLFRRDSFVLGLGAIAGRSLAGITMEEDPRALETRLYHLAATIDEPGTTLVWLDAADPNVESTLRALPATAGKTLVIAVRGKDAEERQRLNVRASGPSARLGSSSRWYYEVEPRFETSEQWIAYLRQLPATRPLDLHIRFGLDGERIQLREGGYAFRKPWHLFVHMVHKLGLPGQWSQLAIVREHSAITEQHVVDSTRLLASRNITFTR